MEGLPPGREGFCSPELATSGVRSPAGLAAAQIPVTRSSSAAAAGCHSAVGDARRVAVLDSHVVVALAPRPWWRLPDALFCAPRLRPGAARAGRTFRCVLSFSLEAERAAATTTTAALADASSG